MLMEFVSLCHYLGWEANKSVLNFHSYVTLSARHTGRDKGPLTLVHPVNDRKGSNDSYGQCFFKLRLNTGTVSENK